MDMGQMLMQNLTANNPVVAQVMRMKNSGMSPQQALQELSKQFSVDFDDAGSIGKRYRREDEIGTPYCVTVDFETEQDGCVTVRDRDTMEQERIKIEDVAAYIAKKISF